ncbi:phage holin family protein [Methylobacterium sp. WL30]|uniref:phage holin family protein n=1 Tax=Methylobacterium sp. WL30 TaxID=2603895 RepID=UPI001FED80C6|nr:phage holin family protein [Methylobacterium sp. WL30]
MLAEALRGAGDVVRGEIALFRQEIIDSLRSVVIGLAAMAGAAVFAIVGFLVLGVVLALTARSRFSLKGLMPTRTGRQLRQDANVIKEHADA